MEIQTCTVCKQGFTEMEPVMAVTGGYWFTDGPEWGHVRADDEDYLAVFHTSEDRDCWTQFWEERR